MSKVIVIGVVLFLIGGFLCGIGFGWIHSDVVVPTDNLVASILVGGTIGTCGLSLIIGELIKFRARRK